MKIIITNSKVGDLKRALANIPDDGDIFIDATHILENQGIDPVSAIEWWDLNHIQVSNPGQEPAIWIKPGKIVMS